VTLAPSQSTLLTGALIFAFILFLAARNRLRVYGAALFGGAGTGLSSSSPIPAPQAGAATSAPSVAPATPSATVTNTPADAAPLVKQTVAPIPGAAISTLHSPTAILTDAMNAANGGQAQTYASALNNAIQLAAPIGAFGF